jgi:hypothetical protein
VDYKALFTPSGEIDDGLMHNILDLVGEAYVPGLQPMIVKQAPVALAESIENFDEVTQALHDTRHAWMLTD